MQPPTLSDKMNSQDAKLLAKASRSTEEPSFTLNTLPIKDPVYWGTLTQPSTWRLPLPPPTCLCSSGENEMHLIHMPGKSTNPTAKPADYLLSSWGHGVPVSSKNSVTSRLHSPSYHRLPFQALLLLPDKEELPDFASYDSWGI